MLFIIPLLFSVAFAFGFYFVSSRKLNLFTRVTLDIILGFFTPILLYVVMFFVTNGNIPHYVLPLFCIGFFITLAFLYPKSEKKNKK